ncbi:hypothetical protein MIND_00070600 [Mycena indigotica]|uniref:Uncharacterized protein n=1 Tax=Mycena indigotica TaxID=2126181 RepID=A0A8H6TBM7_9AGAR|nr:uncharacterized protein MIND_00070600 [Mycena indigotica]KAF7315553.1 hypothetical protein MIND_00070600 [Mycena indigotica]
MKTFTAISLVAAAGVVTAQSLSTNCQNALKGVLASPDALCLNPSALLSFFVPNTSVPVTINKWLDGPTGLCASGFCSNETLAAVVANVTNGCASDLGSVGASSATAASITQVVQQVYPTVRQIACLKDNASNQLCVTETLKNLEDVAGTLSLNDLNFASLFTTVQKVIMGAANLACTNCTKAAFALASQIQIPEFSRGVDGIDALCGSGFVESGRNLQADGVSQTAVNEAFKKQTNDARAFAPSAVLLFFYLFNFNSPFEIKLNMEGSWSVKIEGMRRQLDTTEDNDQKRLEEEIAASRLARQRRSRGLGGTNSLDLTKSNEYTSALRSIDTTTDDRKTSTGEERQDTLNKLSGMQSSTATTTTRPEPMSLAAFMGGKATGPRLNRHAPQQDTSDPTQFVQRTRIDAPHPIFGRGGIAMPGLVTKPSRVGRTPEPEPEVRSRRQSTPSPEKPESTPSTSFRERTISTPNGAKNIPPAIASKPTIATPTFTPTKSATTPLPSNSRSQTPRQSTSPSSVKPVVVTPSLARPVQPEPRSSPQGPQISSSSTPSQAFMRAPVQKDLTPSLSRLQGRGFVQNMVKVSSQLQQTPSPAPTTPRLSSERKASVLDRWPARAASSPSPPQSPTSPAMRRSKTTEQPTPATPPAPRQMTKSHSDEPVPKSDVIADNRIGSASTLVVFQPKNFGVDELGFKRQAEPTSRSTLASTLAESGKPLLHPTKDRARKPKKATTKSAEQSIESTPSASLNVAPSPPEQRSPSPSSILTNRPLPSTSEKPSWSHAIIAPKPEPESKPMPTPAPNQSSGMVGRRALPGMAQAGTAPSISPKPSLNSAPAFTASPRALPGLAGSTSIPATTAIQREAQPEAVPEPPAMHTKASSSGRPSAMDVAQALAEETRTPAPLQTSVEPEPVQPEPVATPRPRNNVSSTAQAEKRRSAYERYSMVLPPLQEEATPDPTPHSTLTRAVANVFAPNMDVLNAKLEDHAPSPEPDVVHIEHSDEPLPRVDISPFATYTAPTLSDSQTIQVDVLSISGSSAFPLGNTHIFHETEVLAIVHRSKSGTTGLMNSTVWSWQGKSSSLGESEEMKLTELAKRYGTTIDPVRQLAEPVQLVQCLGGLLAIRQGSRAHWANENTAMHAIRKLHGVVYIDQVELDVKNVCSGFSYCVSILDTVYVWHGRGSPVEERGAAVEYGKTLTNNPEAVVILTEGENDDDEMFWMALGEEAEYANADYWRWRPQNDFSPRIWSIDTNRKQTVLPLTTFTQDSSPESSIFVMDCVFELFVFVPSLARGKRQDIRLALSIAADASKLLASSRPFTPTVHVVVLPSKIPVDLRVQFRDLEDVFSSDQSVDHMEILTFEEAATRLQTDSWTKAELEGDLLPLGLDRSRLPPSMT